MRKALVPAVLAIALLLAPAIALANTATVQVYTEKAILQVSVYESAVSYAANGSIDINVSVPSWLSGYVDAVVVHIYNASGQTQLAAYDANNTQLATASVVPLSSGYSVTLPADTTKVTLSGSQAWSGTLKIVVESTIEFQVTPPTQITIANGQGEGLAHIKQVSGPAGQIYLVELDPNFDISFRDETPEYQGDTFVETTGAGWEADVPIVVTTSAQPGTYNVDVTMYFKAQDVGALEVATLSFTFDLSGDTGTGSGSTTTTSTTSESIIDQIKADPTKAALIGVGILVFFALIIMAFSGGKGKKGAIKLTGELYIILMMMFVAVIGVAITMLDKTMALALGVGVAAFMILLMFMGAGKIKVSSGG